MFVVGVFVVVEITLQLPGNASENRSGAATAARLGVGSPSAGLGALLAVFGVSMVASGMGSIGAGGPPPSRLRRLRVGRCVPGVAAVQPRVHQELPESVAAHGRIGAINVS